MNDAPPESTTEPASGLPVASSGEAVDVMLPDGLHLRGMRYFPTAPAEGSRLCLCIHGLGVDINVWRFIVPRLCARGLTVLCLDLRGHGLSDAGHWSSLRAGTMARDLRDALDRLGWVPDVLLAQSFGTCVALELLRMYASDVRRPTLYALTPVWSGKRRSWRALPRVLTNTTAFLWTLGRRVGFGSVQRLERRDHTVYAEYPDSWKPRFADEAASVSWRGYAWLLAGLRLREFFVPEDWEAIAGWPVRMVGATHEGLWNNLELERIRQRTGWPLHWLDMRHVSLATDPRHAEPLLSILDHDPDWQWIVRSRSPDCAR